MASKDSLDNVQASQYNLRSPAVKRLLREAAELADSNTEFYVTPLEDNLFEWHFTIRGPPDSEFELGIYHGRIILPPEYPMKPPSFIMLTPNGRFETGTKICLSISSYHPESWRPCWSIRTAVVALISFMAIPSPGAIGSLDNPPDVRRALARKSLFWECSLCGPTVDLVKYKSSLKKHQDESEGLQFDPRSANTVRNTTNPELERSTDAEVSAVPDPAGGDDGLVGDNQVAMLEQLANEPVESIDVIRNDRNSFNTISLYSFTVGAVIFIIAGLVLRRILSMLH